MEGVSTLGGLNIYYDSIVGRLNTDERGKLIGNFLGDDRILVCYKSGDYELTSFETTNRYDAPNIILIEKFDPNKVLSAIYFDGGSKTYYIKRFQIETTTLNKNFNFISDHKNSYLKLVSTEKQPQARVTLIKGKEEEVMEYDLDMLIDIKGWKALGNKLSTYEVKDLSLIESVKPEVAKENESEAEERESDQDDDLEVGSTIDLSVKKDDEEQLGLFSPTIF